MLGGDIGGTSTRILVAAYDGTPVGRGAAGGGNPVSHPETAAAALGTALGEALDGVDPSRVRAAVVGLAGGSALQQPEMRVAFGRVWSESGVTGPVTYVSDLEVAFASGTAEPSGTLLIAGTGAVAGAVRDHRLVKVADGHGWLLGDDGSGFWLGREAARATLRALDRGEVAGPLAASVLRELGALEADVNDLRTHVINVLNTRPPVLLADLAPLVTAAAAAGDPVAEAISTEAARLLVQTVARVRDIDEHTPIVLAGSLTREDLSVGAKLRALIAGQFSGKVLSARDGLGGAAWLALASADPAAATAEARIRLVAT